MLLIRFEMFICYYNFSRYKERRSAHKPMTSDRRRFRLTNGIRTEGITEREPYTKPSERTRPLR